MSEREYYVLEVSKCESCGGECYQRDHRWAVANLVWDRAERGFKRDNPLPSSATEGEYYDWRSQAIDCGQLAADHYWASEGYPSPTRRPPEEYPCPECEGEGKIQRRIPLAEALDALREGVRERGEP